MKIILLLIFLLSFSVSHAQVFDSTLRITDTTKLGKPDNTPVNNRIIYDPSSIDPRPHNKYGYLLNDDKAYNPRYPILLTAGRVLMADAFNSAINIYLFHYDWAKISLQSWKYNLTHKWEWDDDHFGTNFIGHPHSGNLYFNVARSNGYNFWQSIPFCNTGKFDMGILW